MPNREIISGSGIEQKKALAFEVDRLKTDRSDEELAKAAKLMSEQEVNNAVEILRNLQRQVAERGQ